MAKKHKTVEFRLAFPRSINKIDNASGRNSLLFRKASGKDVCFLCARLEAQQKKKHPWDKR
jgi:hypothetical protein